MTFDANTLALILTPIGAAIGAWAAIRVKLAQVESIAKGAAKEADRANDRIDRVLERA